MRVVKQKKVGGESVLSMKLSGSGDFDEYEWNIAAAIPQLLAAEYSTGLFSAQLLVHYWERVSLENWAQCRRTTEEFLFALNCILSVANECAKCGLRIQNLGWDMEEMAVDPNTGIVYISYWPTRQDQFTYGEILNFLLGMVERMNRHNCDPFITDGLSTCIYQDGPENLGKLMADCSKLQSALGYAGAVAAADHAVQTMLLGGSSGLIWLEPVYGGSVIVVKTIPAQIGRDQSQCDVVLEAGSGASRVHAKITRGGEGFYLTDLNSTNGTFMDGRQLPAGQPVQITAGAHVAFGDAEYVVAFS